MAGRTSYRLFDITLARRTQVSPSLVRFTFTGPQVSQMATHAPDQRIKLFFPKDANGLDALFEIAKLEEHDWFGAYRALPEAQRPPMRTYTIRALRPARAEVDVEFVLHGDNGPASRWAMRARPGDRLAMTAPLANAGGEKLGYEWKPPRGVRRILIVADETALPAAAGIFETLDELPLAPRVEALIEVPRSDDIQLLSPPAKLRWLTRDTEPNCQHGDLLMRALRDIDLHQEIRALGGQQQAGAADTLDQDDAVLWEPATLDDNAPFYAWIAAETKVTRNIRRYLVNECGLPKQCVTSMGYWRQGKADD
ncbi:siderophore-interacting protein [Halomonas sp. ML-15]|uniref:siderophore-interacting protein n=1 Tax=Halomonas sp. ML-15 TaxID=2773305 RepID=UPI001745E934|nr:siderophore-interacting protein [Halomonas sp. ML-15]MBD3896433.1 siderophore-interacting protein [Halomonas sp. ML-15]